MRWPKLDPITRRRFRRFYALKRARYSLYIFGFLYVVGMLANVICNDLPLLVRHEGSYYFPFVKYYPDDVFTGSGQATRPKYKEIAKSEAFAEGSGNWMLFAPIPYGPNEGFTAATIEVDELVEVGIARKRLVGSVDVAPDFSIRRSVAAAYFYGLGDERALRDKSLLEQAPLSDGFRSAVEARFGNSAEAPAISEVLTLSSGLKVEASMAAYSPRDRPPSTVRVSLREQADGGAADKVVFHEDGSVDTHPGTLWAQFGAEQQAAVAQRVEERRAARVQPLSLQIGEVFYELDFKKEDVHFPFRPTPDHWLGLDSSGRDVFARIFYALRISMNFGFLLVIATFVVGIAIGGIQGYFGGKIDLLGQRTIEIWESLPFLYIMILLGSVYGRSFTLLLVLYGIFNWIGISYYMRGEFLKVRKLPYIEAAHCMGLPSIKIMFRHILPNALVPIITFFPFSLVAAISSLSALDYLGFGLPAPTPSWGELLGQAQEFRYAWWLVLYPSSILFIVILLGAFIGEGLRAAFDPKMNTHYES